MRLSLGHAAVIAALVPTGLVAQRHQLTVAINVSADTQFVAQIQSVLTRELRRFTDVAIAHQGDPRRFILSVSALPLRFYTEGQLRGIALSWVMADEHGVNHRAAVIRSDELNLRLERIVAEFDTMFLDPARSRGR